MPAQFAPLRNKSPLEFLGMIPGPAILSDVDELANIFQSLPFAKRYREQLLNAVPERISADPYSPVGEGREISKGISKSLIDDIKEFLKGSPGLASEPNEEMPSVVHHVYRDPQGNPIGYLTQDAKSVAGIAIDPTAPPTLRAKALLNLAKPVIQGRLDLGHVTDEGAEMVQKLQELAKRYFSRASR